jgi:hypothetical protein
MSSVSGSFEERFRADASLFVQMFDAAQDRLLLVQLAESDFKAASFLDQRVLTPNRPCEWVAWSELARISGGLPATAQFIFHIGHVGSTLISRLLGEMISIFSVREPLLLRSLAELHRLRDRATSPWPPDAFEPRLSTALGWLSKSFRPGQQAIVKATSFVSELAPPILQRGGQALFLYADPQTYLETILAGPASLHELAVLSGDRLARLHARLAAEPWLLWQLGVGERAAMAWACEMTALEAATETVGPERILWLDFDHFLEAPAENLVRIAGHFGHPLEDGAAASLVSGSIMHSYSKAPEHGYSRALRSEVLAGARAEHGEELRRGMSWLEKAARDFPLVTRAISRASRKG